MSVFFPYVYGRANSPSFTIARGGGQWLRRGGDGELGVVSHRLCCTLCSHARALHELSVSPITKQAGEVGVLKCAHWGPGTPDTACYVMCVLDTFAIHRFVFACCRRLQRWLAVTSWPWSRCCGPSSRC
jgi:hypothetical protein